MLHYSFCFGMVISQLEEGKTDEPGEVSNLQIKYIQRNQLLPGGISKWLPNMGFLFKRVQVSVVQ